MKKLNYIVLSLLVSTFALTSCDALLNADSERYTFENDFQMKSAHDTIYSMVGVFSQLQKLGDRYILLGELRSELMETKVNASKYLKEINDFKYTKENPYINQKDYYAVINSCNYVTHYVDTSYSILSDKAMMRSYAAAKAIRAWTYLQLALNFNTVYYYTNPITTVADATKSYPSIGLLALADSLIADLYPLRNINTMDLGTFGAFKVKQTVLPIKFILGDLYLWKGDYDNAARAYYDLMYTTDRTIAKEYISSWTVDSKKVFQNYTPLWNAILEPNNPENIATIASSASYGQQFTVDSLSYHYDIAPSAIAINKWAQTIYYVDSITIGEGDLRAHGSYYQVNEKNSTLPNAYDPSENPYITKYQTMNTSTEKCLVIYRNSLLYLRYAEAVNRLGCPQLAFTVLKKGLTELTTRPAVIRNEVLAVGNGSTPTYMNFNDTRFSTNVGIRQRGLGNINTDTRVYVIPTCSNKADSITYVENAIVEELALETAFEGNRFHDLMRIAIRRGNPEYLAEKVSAKYLLNKAEMKSTLMDPLNWYLPH
jgi:starch-binding outer membrane protein, SusD/RagB family